MFQKKCATGSGESTKNNIVPRINGAPEYSTVQKWFPSTQINRKIVDNENCFICFLFFTVQYSTV